jgi:hypothetical protein
MQTLQACVVACVSGRCMQTLVSMQGGVMWLADACKR